jgi:hypothetical protein
MTPALLVVGIHAGYGQALRSNVSPSRDVSTEWLAGLGQVEPEVYQDSTGKMIMAGAGLGVVGFAIGGLAAAVLFSGCDTEYCELEAGFYGAAALGTFGMAYGVHLGNARRGNLALDFLTGAAVWTAGIVALSALDWDESAKRIAFVGIPIVQLVATMSVESSVARKRAEAPGISVGMMRQSDGGVALAVSLSS